MRAAKDQARQHICAVSPEHLKIAHKRWDKDEGSANFIGQFKKNLYKWHMRAVKDQARQQIRAASPEPLQITLKRKNKDEGLGQISKASSRKFGTNRICEQRSLKMKGC